MTDASDMIERHGRILAELAEIGMTIARGLRAEAETGETPEAQAQAVTAFPRVARAVRQTLALEAKLKRDARREAVEVEAHARRELDLRIRRRKALVRAEMRRSISDATPDDDDELFHDRIEDLRDRLDIDLLDADFADRPLEDVIADLCIQLGLAPPDDPIPPPPGEVSAQPTEGVRPDAEATAPPTAAEQPRPHPPPEPTPEPYFRYSSG